jgi:dTDP-4-dehydrorhamnose reductase
MKVLVTGAAGMLGRDAVAACAARGHDVVALDHEALDIADGPAVDAAMRDARPDAVVNCAAWTDVDGAEANEAGATRLNDEAAAVVASSAAEAGAKFVFLSSDYVFDGAKRTPYVESDRPNPLSAYGRSKAGGETSIPIANPRHFVVRSAWLFGAGGPNFVEKMLELAVEQPEVVVVSDQVGCPTYTVHLARALAELVETDDYGVHHLAAAGSCSWYEFALQIFDQAGLDTSVMATTSEALGRPAKRPAYSALASERRAEPLPHWREGLAEYVALRHDVAPAARGVAP